MQPGQESAGPRPQSDEPAYPGFFGFYPACRKRLPKLPDSPAAESPQPAGESHHPGGPDSLRGPEASPHPGGPEADSLRGPLESSPRLASAQARPLGSVLPGIHVWTRERLFQKPDGERSIHFVEPSRESKNRGTDSVSTTCLIEFDCRLGSFASASLTLLRIASRTSNKNKINPRKTVKFASFNTKNSTNQTMFNSVDDHIYQNQSTKERKGLEILHDRKKV